jgi:hypothetical protein
MLAEDIVGGGTSNAVTSLCRFVLLHNVSEDDSAILVHVILTQKEEVSNTFVRPNGGKIRPHPDF